MNNKVNTFLVVLMNASGLKEFFVNTTSSFSAKVIAEAIHSASYRVIEVKEVA